MYPKMFFNVFKREIQVRKMVEKYNSPQENGSLKQPPFILLVDTLHAGNKQSYMLT